MKLTWPPDLCFSLMHSLVALWPLRTRRCLLTATRVTYVRTFSCTGNDTSVESCESIFMFLFKRYDVRSLYEGSLQTLLREIQQCVYTCVFCVCNFLFEIVTISTLETIQQQVRK